MIYGLCAISQQLTAHSLLSYYMFRTKYNPGVISFTGAPMLPSVRKCPSVRESLVEDSDQDCYKVFISELKEGLPSASVFLPGKHCNFISITLTLFL